MNKILPRVLVRIVLLIAAVYLITTLVSLSGRISSAKDDGLRLAESERALRAEHDSLTYDLEHKDSQAVIEKYAGQKLGLGYEDEVVFYQD